MTPLLMLVPPVSCKYSLVKFGTSSGKPSKVTYSHDIYSNGVYVMAHIPSRAISLPGHGSTQSAWEQSEHLDLAWTLSTSSGKHHSESGCATPSVPLRVEMFVMTAFQNFKWGGEGGGHLKAGLRDLHHSNHCDDEGLMASLL